MALKTYTLKFATLGADLDNFQISSNGGAVNPPMASRSQLLAGLTINADETASVLTITSTGFCTNSTTVNLPTSNPPTGGGTTPPCAGTASVINVTVGNETETGQTTECRDDFNNLISSGNPEMERTVTFTLADCDGTPIVAATNIPISVRLDGVYCGGPGTVYQTATIMAGQSSTSITFISSFVDNGGAYANCGCYTTNVYFGAATSPNYPTNVV